MKVKFKRLSITAETPAYAKAGDAGLDLTATSKTYGNTYIEYGTSIAVEIPEGYAGFIFPRSSVTKYGVGVSLKNSVGVIDSGYRGEIKLRFEYPDGYLTRSLIENTILGFPPDNVPEVGEKIGQLIIMPIPAIELEEVEDLTPTDRGSGGFGSTGK